jgi:hypothetical protein
MSSEIEKPHALCIPYPAQSHIKAMLKLAKLLYNQGCRITFVNTEYNHRRFLRSGGPDSMSGLPDFRFETIPDGLPPSDSDTTQNIPELSESIRAHFLSPFVTLLEKTPAVTCIVSDGFMPFTIDAGKKLGVPVVLFWTICATALMGFLHVPDLHKKGFTPLKDASYLTNGYLDTEIDWIPGIKSIRLRNLPTIIRNTDPNYKLFKYCMEIMAKSREASAYIIHTFDELEPDVLTSLTSIMPLIYTVGPVQLLLDQIPKENHLESIGYSLWKEDLQCLEWLDTRKQKSVLYVNFGSIATMSSEKVVEFARGLVNSGQVFLWIIRPDMIVGESAVLLDDLLESTKNRGFICAWCPQEKVLNHPSVGGFLTHCGWSSIVESVSAGVPMICLPFVGEQPVNSWAACNEWEIGLELDGDFKSEDVEKVVRELMHGEKGYKMKNKAVEWKTKADKAISKHGSSSINLNMFVARFFSDIIH